jgi:hypothetical protein
MKEKSMAAPRDIADELRILEAQLNRMRGMLGAYSGLFFRQITIWGVLSLLLLALSGLSTGAPVAVLLLFVVPFAFLEAGYTFYYTVFARRHAEFLERAINTRLGGDVLAAHRLEAAYFYEPDAPKLSFLSFGRLSGYGSVMTIGYSIAAALLWGAGLDEGLSQLAAGGMHVGVLIAGLLWTLGVTLYLLWHFLSRRDEERLLAALRVAYPDAVGSRGRAQSGR